MKKLIWKIIIAVVLAVAAVFFLFPVDIGKEMRIPNKNNSPVEISESFQYTQRIEQINGNIQRDNMLEENTKYKRIEILPVLAHDSIFGFEKTSSMAERKKATAAINGGFFYSYGQPSGFTVIDGKLLCTAPELTNRPVFLMNQNRELKMLDLNVQVTVSIGRTKLKVDGVNRSPKEHEIIVFTPKYGLTTRVNGRDTFNLIAENQIISDFASSNVEVNIPRTGLILTATGNRIKDIKSLTKYKGENIYFDYQTTPACGKIVQGLEGGFWVVKAGNKVVKTREKWVGLTTNREPRTIVGLKDKYTAVFMTVDGRQPGYSIGLTGEELADYLLSLGIRDALMLDGGASTTMVVEGKIVNRPSYRGRERMVGGAVVIKFDK
ncbi:MAG: hypothetical protein PWQ70_1362 [Clostridiales bacterium]|nr:hypothetical protein [Clostridiales bacterium]